jgi:transcriptional regulator with GAF, ATPase, and Fis domain
MSASALRLLDFLRVDEQAGTIHLNERRALLLDAEAIGLLRRELIEALGTEGARRVLSRFGFAHGFRVALALRTVADGQSDDEWLRAGPQMHAAHGAVRVERVHLRFDRGAGIFEDESVWHNSLEAEQHRQHLGPSSEPVCWTIAGYSSGFATALFGSPVFYLETACAGSGERACRIVGRAEQQMSREMRSQLKHFRGDEIADDLRSLRSEQELSVTELRRRQAEVWALRSQLHVLQEAIKAQFGAGTIVGVSAAHRELMDQAERVAGTDATVLIMGETGTGKELVAREIHYQSTRRDRPLITINCAALPASLVESELFGHEKGAFTGADRRKPGRFELADGGTLFLDEIGELPPESQAKLLRVLQHGEIDLVGGTRPRRVDVRVLAATNRPLDKLVAEGKFRADLFYRLNVVPLVIPPLRDRRDDILALAEEFVRKYCARFRKPVSLLGPAVRERLLAYSWPGNARELEHMIERAVLLADGPELTIDLPAAASSRDAGAPELRPPENHQAQDSLALLSLADMERVHIERVLQQTGGVVEGKHGAATLLGMNASTLRSRMKKLGIRNPRTRRS